MLQMGALSQIAIKLNRSTDAGLKCSTSLTHIKSFAANVLSRNLNFFPVQFIAFGMKLRALREESEQENRIVGRMVFGAKVMT